MKFISHGTKYNTFANHVNAPLFKHVFDCDCDINATLTISVAGLYRLFLNGEELNKSLFAPTLSNPDQVVFEDKYDLSGKLKRKNNVLCVLLGNGFNNCSDYNIWGNDTAPYRAAPKFALLLKADGKTVVESDEKFVVTDSPITFDDFRAGERYDANLEIEDVLTSVSTDGFEPATVVDSPKGKIVPDTTQPVAAGEPKKAINIIKIKTGYLYDFGVNDTGVCKLSLLSAQSGQKIDLYFGEVLDGDDCIDYRNISFDNTDLEYNQHDEYICKNGAQTYMPSFTWHGFRYCEARGLTAEQATSDALTFVSTRTALPETCKFTCDNDTVNKLTQLTLQSDKSNFVYYPYDCPHREKNGWTADAALSAEQMLYSFDAHDSLAQWLLQIRNAQTEIGALPGIVPTAGWGFNWGNGPAWDSVLVELTYQLYRFYGDEKVVKDNADAINKYFVYISGRLNDDGLVNIGLGDWCQTYTKWEGDFETPVEITDSLTMLDLAAKAIKIFKAIDLPSDFISDFAEKLTLNFRKKYICDGKLREKTQTGLAMALQTGVLSGEEDSLVYADLLELIHGQDDHFRVGVVGYKYLFETLTAHGDCDLCFKLITQKSFPSYGYWVEQGATSLWESFEEYYRDEQGRLMRKDGTPRLSSFNHHFWGGVLAWFYKYIGWIDVKSADTVEISPTILNGVNRSEMSYSRNGKSISVKWEKLSDHIKLNVKNQGFNCVFKHNGQEKILDGERELLID